MPCINPLSSYISAGIESVLFYSPSSRVDGDRWVRNRAKAPATLEHAKRPLKFDSLRVPDSSTRLLLSMGRNIDN